MCDDMFLRPFGWKLEMNLSLKKTHVKSSIFSLFFVILRFFSIFQVIQCNYICY